VTIKSLDPDTHAHVTQVIDRARRAGANIPTRLNEAKLLWTRERERTAKLEALRDLIQEMDTWMPHEYLRTVNRTLTNCTPAEMHQAMLGFVHQYLAKVKSQ
jgi:hypothetical protein